MQNKHLRPFIRCAHCEGKRHWKGFVIQLDDGSLALVVADTLPVQMDLMKAGLSKGQVGQRPFEMGYKTMYFLKDIKEGKPAPADPTYTGLDVCTPETADTCIGK